MNPLAAGWKWLTAAAGDLLWPPVCATCSRLLPFSENPLTPEAHFCPECLSDIEFLPRNICRICGRPFYGAGEPGTFAADPLLPSGHICGDCLASPPPYRTARSAVAYLGPVARSISLLKYHGGLNQAPALAGLAAAALVPSGDVPESPPDVIVPMPLSSKRLTERGFNQALELARALYRPGRGLINDMLLSRTADGGQPQAVLSGSQRRKAVRGCFSVPAPGAVKGARILLFDDVLTTGATAGEAARTLLAAGAARVDLATIARTVLRSWLGF